MWSVAMHSEAIWSVAVHSEAIWSVAVHSEAIWSVTVHSEAIWSVAVHSEAIWSVAVHSEAIWSVAVHSEAILSSDPVTLQFVVLEAPVMMCFVLLTLELDFPVISPCVADSLTTYFNIMPSSIMFATRKNMK